MYSDSKRDPRFTKTKKRTGKNGKGREMKYSEGGGRMEIILGLNFKQACLL